MPSEPIQITILGKRWRLRFAHNLANGGDVDAPHVREKEIRISANLEPKRELEVIIHELTHAAFWHLDESYVEEFGNDVARVLARLGYGKIQ